MLITLLKQVGLSRLGRRFAGSTAGNIAVEFAVILPALLLFYLSAFDGSQAVSANSKVDVIGSTIGDLVSRSTTMNAGRFSNIMAISSAILNPFSTEGLVMTVTTLRIDANGKAVVDWSKSTTGGVTATGQSPGDAYALPPHLQSFASSYLVVTTITYPYKTLLSYGGLITDVPMGSTYVFRPRKSAEIPFG